HEQHETDGTKPFRCLQTGHSRIILENVIDAKAEDSSLPGDAEKLRGNAQGEMPSSEHVPGLGNQKERRDICDYQQAEFRRLEQSFVHVKQRPYQSKNRSYKEVQQSANNRQNGSDDDQLSS